MNLFPDYTNSQLIRTSVSTVDAVVGTPKVLRAYRTTPRTLTGETPFSLSFEAEAIVSIEIGLSSSWVEQFNSNNNEQVVRSNFDLLEGKREVVRLRTAEYKNQVARYYNSKVRMRRSREGVLALQGVMSNTKDPTIGVLGLTWEGPYRSLGMSDSPPKRLLT